MLDHSFFNFSPSCLVRMSKDDIIDQYNIFPIVPFVLWRKSARAMTLLFIRLNKTSKMVNGEQSKKYIESTSKNKSTSTLRFKYWRNLITQESWKYMKSSMTPNTFSSLLSIIFLLIKVDYAKEQAYFSNCEKDPITANPKPRPFSRKSSRSFHTVTRTRSSTEISNYKIWFSAQSKTP